MSQVGVVKRPVPCFSYQLRYLHQQLEDELFEFSKQNIVKTYSEISLISNYVDYVPNRNSL